MHKLLTEFLGEPEQMPESMAKAIGPASVESLVQAIGPKWQPRAPKQPLPPSSAPPTTAPQHG